MVEEHDVVFRGASFAGGGEAPVLLQRTDEDPVGVLLEKLATEEGRAEIARSLAEERDKEGDLRLYQPVHRIWHLALLEAACQAPGEPRLDPARIESAGLVIRRLREGKQDKKIHLEGWRRAGRKLRGWIRFGPGEERHDPDPGKRRPVLASGHPEIDRRLALLRGGELLEESVSPLFVAPPEVCKAAGKTLLYGLVPVTSSERSESPAAPDLDEEEEANFVDGARQQIPLLLKSTSEQTYPWNGQELTKTSKAGTDNLMAVLQHLHIQLDAFDGGPAGRRVIALLNQVALPYGSTTRGAGDVLTEAAEVLLFETEGKNKVRMPDVWPAIPESLRNQIEQAAVAAMRARLATLTAGEGRFSAPNGRYVLEAFLRVKSHHPGCPSRLVWTRKPSPPSSMPGPGPAPGPGQVPGPIPGPSQSFKIVPWYEAGALPPHQVALPDVSDRGALRKLKPNVAFVLPAGLKRKIDAAGLDKLIEGGAGTPGGWDLGWICGFNIPLITICAFFVLNIFLQLLNIVFFWLPFIKICIPFPRKSNG